jgi:hypothetical protein
MKTNKHAKPQRRVYADEPKEEAVQKLFDGHSAPSVAHEMAGQHSFRSVKR